MDEEKLSDFIREYRIEQHISPLRQDEEFEEYIKDGIFDIDEYCGTEIDFKEDLKARRLLKYYVLYADYKKLAEFKELYIKDYDELQRKYYINSKLQ